MNKREATFWDFLSRKIGNTWSVQRHEDKYSTGIPDLSYGVSGINGWIELKACDKWPTKGVPYFTAVQANWLFERGKRGGHCFVLIQVGTYILLFGHESVYDLLGDLSREKMISLCINWWRESLSPSEFIEEITR